MVLKRIYHYTYEMECVQELFFCTQIVPKIQVELLYNPKENNNAPFNAKLLTA